MRYFVLFFCVCFGLEQVHFPKNVHAQEISSPKYYYATATGYGIKMRNGPGTQYKENELKLSKNAYANAPRKILYDDYLFGLIVDDTIVKGNDECSAWQKIVAVHTSWDSEEQVKPLCETENGTNNFKCSETAYICKDFIKISPIDYSTQNRGTLTTRLRKLNSSH